MTAAKHLKHLPAKLAAHRLFASAEPDPVCWQAIKAAGIDLDYVTNLAGPIVRTLASITPEGCFEIDHSFGETVFAMAVHDEDAETVLDLVAWSARDPFAFGSTFGAAGVLGLDTLLNPASYDQGPCMLFESPLAWLQGRCAGAVVLDYQEAREALRRAPGPVTTETPEEADSLLRSGIIPGNKILVPATWSAVA
jgi:hypothetical protein